MEKNLLFTKFDEIGDAPVVGFFAVGREEAAGNLACCAVIAYALAAKPPFGTVIGTRAAVFVFFQLALHFHLLSFNREYDFSRVVSFVVYFLFTGSWVMSKASCFEPTAIPIQPSSMTNCVTPRSFIFGSSTSLSGISFSI